MRRRPWPAWSGVQTELRSVAYESHSPKLDQGHKKVRLVLGLHGTEKKSLKKHL